MATSLQTPPFPNQLCVKDCPICAWQSIPCQRKAQRSQGQLHPLSRGNTIFPDCGSYGAMPRIQDWLLFSISRQLSVLSCPACPITTLFVVLRPVVSCINLPTQQARRRLQPTHSFLPTRPTSFCLHGTTAYRLALAHGRNVLVPSAS